MMFLQKDLRFRITPKSGPLRPMDTLLDAERALGHDLPKQFLKKPHWREAGWAVLRAAETGVAADVGAATELLVSATDAEGWMDRADDRHHKTASDDRPNNVTYLRGAGPDAKS